MGSLTKSLTGNLLGGNVGSVLGLARGGGGSSVLTAPTVATPTFPEIKPLQFNAGGLTTAANDGTISVTPSAARTSLVQQIQDALSKYGTNLTGLLPQVQAGAGGLSDAVSKAFSIARQTLADRRQAMLGDLQENLAQRRISGSSFASDALARADAEFSKATDELAANEGIAKGQSFLQELQMTTNLLSQVSQAQTAAFNAGLNELNLEAGIAHDVQTSTNTAFAQNANIQAQLLTQLGITQANLNAKANEGTGKLFGSILGPVASPLLNKIGTSVGNIFGSVGGGGAAALLGDAGLGGAGAAGVGAGAGAAGAGGLADLLPLLAAA